ncbi:hypothetical protein [Flavobacterium chungangense]|uniref:Uncharacterized protein n=1 Tax=Flavobacterium chungangense TaxID=554283 RepID=A0A6V6ZDI9_9FLAO|nr:hypothetical protein [Flavobacterium chungangense]CAD0009858.1 hypothetical protein FLACHUCJ7_04498 [Flavobacterium chungangense]
MTQEKQKKDKKQHSEKIEITWKQATLRLLREFWLALTLSFLWTITKVFFYPDNDVEGNPPKNLILYAISTFSYALAFTSYITGNFWRVKRQGAQEKGISKTLENIREYSFQTINYVTGGDSYIFLTCDKGSLPVFRLRQMGQYPIPKLLIVMHDVVGGVKEYYQIPFSTSYVSAPIDFQIPTLNDGDEKRYSINIITPNAAITGVRQEYILRKKGAIIFHANKAVLIFNNQKIVNEEVDNGFLNAGEENNQLFQYF